MEGLDTENTVWAANAITSIEPAIPVETVKQEAAVVARKDLSNDSTIARGRNGRQNSIPTSIALDDQATMRGKCKQFATHGRRAILAFPGGGG